MIAFILATVIVAACWIKFGVVILPFVLIVVCAVLDSLNNYAGRVE